MFLLIGIILFIVVLYWDVSSDFKKWKKNIPIQHTKEAFVRAVLLLPLIALLIFSGVFSWWKLLTVPFMIGSVWWEFFDGWYNSKRGLPWRFNGSKDVAGDSKLDRLLMTLNPSQQTFLKWGLIIASIISYILL